MSNSVVTDYSGMVIHDSSEGRDVLQVGAMTALVRLLHTVRFSQRSPSKMPRNKWP